MASLGQELKKERELRGISINEIADTTKISLRFFRALEDDNLELLPSKFFIKGIIRAYCEYLGMEPEPFLNQYYEIERLKEEAEEEQQVEGTETNLPYRYKKVFLILVIAFIFLAVLAGVYFLLIRNKSPEPESQSFTPPVIQEEVPSPPPEIVEAEEPPVVKPSQLDLEISFTEETWIQVFTDGKLALDGLKYPGETFEATAQEELIFYSGNAGGFTFLINGKKGKPFGRLGDVVRDIRITLENMEQFLEETPPDEDVPQ